MKQNLVWTLLIAAAVLWNVPQCKAQQTQATAAPAGGPIIITLDEAIHRAQANEPAFAASVAESKAAGLDRSIARAALLPSAVYHNQVLYTQPNGQQNQAGQGVGSQPSPRFIANRSEEHTSELQSL